VQKGGGKEFELPRKRERRLRSHCQRLGERVLESAEELEKGEKKKRGDSKHRPGKGKGESEREGAFRKTSITD